MIRRVFVLPAVALVLVVASCSSDGGSDGGGATSAKRTTTTAAGGGASADAAYEGHGPHEVGTLTLAGSDGRRIVVWYPAAASAKDQPDGNFDIASLLTPELQAQIPPELRPDHPIDAHQGAEPATGGPFPVVLFSHGFAGFPEQSADLTSHLAQWGFVVIAPDHVERSLSGLLGTAARDVAPRPDGDVLSDALTVTSKLAQQPGSPLEGMLDLDHVAAAGHSAGAEAVYELASTDDRVDAFIAYSLGDGTGEDGKGTPPPVPKVPGMVMAGTKDGIIPFATTKAVYEGMEAPKWFVEIEGAGHLVFSDICLIGRDQGGIVALVHEAGLDIPQDLLTLASDGCEKGDLKPEEAFAAIDHLSVAFLRATFGIDPAPVGLDPAVTKAFTTAHVTLTADPG